MLTSYAELSVGQRIQMDVVDDAATLRQAYTGFWQWFHLTALIVFLLPYVWFVVREYGAAQFGIVKDGVTLWEATARFIWNGGEHIKEGFKFNFWPFLAFVFALLFNGLRVLMLWKAKSLELAEQVRGIPTLFDFLRNPRWGLFHGIMKYLSWISIGVLFLNSFHFMGQQVRL